jgi:phage gp29-like protein
VIFGNLFGPDGMNGRDGTYGISAAAQPISVTAPTTAIVPALPSNITGGLGRILRPQAAVRWILPQLAAITPQYIEMVLRSALAGDHVRQWELFDLMLDTWPELSSCCQELTYGVMRKKLIWEPFAVEDEEPEDEAVDRMQFVCSALRAMRPDPAADENDFRGTLSDIVSGWFQGVTVLEVDWVSSTLFTASRSRDEERKEAHEDAEAGRRVESPEEQETEIRRYESAIVPRATFWAHPTNFVWCTDGKLRLRTASVPAYTLQGPGDGMMTDFPPYKFLIGIHKSKAGSALGGALLRPLAWWWCAANFSSDWLLNLAQTFGLPFRWANYAQNSPQATVDAICNMLQNMGSAGWAAFPEGTTLELKEASGKTGDSSPQGDLLDRADRYARMLVLGQTLSGSQDASKGGGKAFGEVESRVKDDRIDAAAEYAANVINAQLVPAILALNYGDDEYSPTCRFLEEEEGGLADAQRDQVLISAGLDIGKNFLRKKYAIPAPAEEEEIVTASREGGGKAEGKRLKAEGKQDGKDGKKGKKGSEDDLAAQAKALLGITDDAVFARELEKLTGTL